MSQPVTPQSGRLGLAGTSGTRELLRRLELDVVIKLDGMLHGDHLGLVPGHGSEPGETRRYVPGDDVRRIDWNVTARTQEVYVRQSVADRELETHLLVDLSPSLNFGTALYEKRDLSLAAAAAVGLLTSKLGNRVGAVLALPGKVVAIPPRSGRAHLLAILDRIATAPRVEGSVPDLELTFARAQAISRRFRGLVVYISDFLGDDAWKEGLRRLSLRHEVLAIEVLDPRELELPDVGVLSLVDPSTGRSIDVATGNAKVRDRYAAAAREQRAQIATDISASGAEHVILRTDEDWILELARFVALRRSRGAARSKVGR